VRYILEDGVWILAVAVWVPELMIRGVLSPEYGWFIAVFFVAAMAVSRRAHSQSGLSIWRVLHVGVPVAILLSFLASESSGNWNELWVAIKLVLPFLVVMFGLYIIVAGWGGRSDD
jgi:hypothetical protein